MDFIKEVGGHEREAANSFKATTPTGTDRWDFAEIVYMPDPVLRSLGKLLQEIKNSAVPPPQMFMNLLASLPKSDGGIRTLAIATTLYRLLMQLAIRS